MTNQANLKPVTNRQRKSQSAWDARLSRYAHALVNGVARHWLAFFNLAWLLYMLLPFLAPTLLYWGYPQLAALIYKVYSIFCHQFPDHSYFLFGHTHVPSQEILWANGLATNLNILQERAFVGNSQLGYKVAICQRDVAIYGSILLAGLLFALVRQRLERISLKIYIVLLLPMAIDGVTQLFGWRDSNWWLRSATGALFGIATVWLVYPFVQAGMDEVLVSEGYKAGVNKTFAAVPSPSINRSNH